MTIATDSLPQLLGFGGLLESGKDAIADHLVTQHGFAKVNMSDPIDACLYALDPIVRVGVIEYGFLRRVWRALMDRKVEVKIIRYRALRDDLGFTEAKKIPEVRALLQRLGVEMGRNIIDPNIWVNLARKAITILRADGIPVCISGIRFKDEQELVHELGGQLVWVDRPGHRSAATATTSSHASEISLADYNEDIVVVNDGTLDDLHTKAEGLIR